MTFSRMFLFNSYPRSLVHSYIHSFILWWWRCWRARLDYDKSNSILNKVPFLIFFRLISVLTSLRHIFPIYHFNTNHSIMMTHIRVFTNNCCSICDLNKCRYWRSYNTRFMIISVKVKASDFLNHRILNLKFINWTTFLCQ